MKDHVTIVPIDGVLGVDGVFLRMAYTVDDPSVWAIQWYNGRGHIEYSNKAQQGLEGEADYTRVVAPFVTLWESEKARLDAETAQAEAQRLALYNSTAARAERVRAERDRRLAACDYLMMPDYPLPDASRAAWVDYRQALRNLTVQDGFPWTGADDEQCPWPTRP